MKKKKFNGKLSLNKETISLLQEKEMEDVKGGFTFTIITGIYITTHFVDINTWADEGCPGQGWGL